MATTFRALSVLLAVGCATPRQQTPDPCRQAPTWHQDVAPILSEHCTSCHAEGGVAQSWPWTDYASTQPRADAIAQAVDEGLMPPFIAADAEDCTPRYPFLHDPSLDAATVDAITAWAECGAPEGDPKHPAPLPEPPVVTLADWDVEIAPAEPYVPPANADALICFGVPVPDEWFSEDGEIRWIDAMEVVPGDLSVAHHIHVQIFPFDSEIAGREEPWECNTLWGGVDLGGWLPGSPPTLLPAGAAFPVRATDWVAFQVHYHVSDDGQHSDRTAIRFRFTDAPTGMAELFRVGNVTTAAEGLLPGPNDAGAPEFRIPAGAAGHTESIRMPIGGDPQSSFDVFVVTHHMHRVGTGMRMWVEHDPATRAADEPAEECLLATPRYDPDWQGFFYYDVDGGKAPVVRGGDDVRIECTYDNTTDNDAWMATLAAEGLPLEPIDVEYGSDMLDEMCAAMVGAVKLP